QPPAAEAAVAEVDRRDKPRVRADGAYGNKPTAERAANAGFRMEAPKRGKTRAKGVGRIRCSVERGHTLLAHFGRSARRFDRQVGRYLAWVQRAACIIILLHEDNGFVR